MKTEIHSWGRCIALCLVIGIVGHRMDSGLNRIATSMDELRSDSVTGGGMLYARFNSVIQELHSIAVGIYSQK
jgi:hypothetical protein